MTLSKAFSFLLLSILFNVLLSCNSKDSTLDSNFASCSYCKLEPMASSDNIYEDKTGRKMRVVIDSYNKWARIDIDNKRLYLPYIENDSYKGFKDDLYEFSKKDDKVYLFKNQSIIFKQLDKTLHN